MIFTKLKPYFLALLFIIGCWFIGQGMYIHAKAWLSQVLLEQAWNNVKSGQQQARPWPWADTWPVARLSVPRLDIDLIVLAGDSGRNLAFGPAHNFASVNPGEAGSSIISGHRDTHFSFLQHLHTGDIIFIETPLGKKQQYTIQSTQVTNSQNARFYYDESSPLLHLVTCYPFDSIIPGGPERYIASAIAKTPNN